MRRNSNEFDLNQLDGYNILHQGSLALARAERHGIRIDSSIYNRKIKELDDQVVVLLKQFNDSKLGRAWRHRFGDKTKFGSDHQLKTMLYSVYKITPPKMTDSGDGSTDEEALRACQLPELELLLQIRKLEKVSGTYLKSYVREEVDGYIHPFFALNTVTTYRSSSHDPNLQNVPIRDADSMEHCRSGMFGDKGHHIMEVDFSGVEVGMAACYHKDPEMLRYLHDPKSDMHGDVAYDLYKLKPYKDYIGKNGFKADHSMYRLRQGGKNSFVFPQFYGDYYVNCAIGVACTWGKMPAGRWEDVDGIILPDGQTLGSHLIEQNLRSLDEFTEHVKQVEDFFWNKRFKVYNAWKKTWFAEYQKKGYFDTLTGFRCSGVMRRNEVTNYPVQGSAFHWLLRTLIETDRVMRKEKWETSIIGEVHDSMMLSVAPHELKYVVKTINHIACVWLKEQYPWIIVPIKVEFKIAPVDRPWSELKEMEEAA